MPRTPAISEIFHEETKYAVDRMDRFNKAPDWHHPPSQFKAYHTENAIELAPYLDAAASSPGAPGLGEIARLLYFTNGATGVIPLNHGMTQIFRAAPSAGALYPTEVYVAVRAVPGLADGIYNYLVRDNSLVPAWEGDFWSAFERYALGHEAVAQAQIVVFLSGIWERSTWRYRERAYRRILLDTGHVLGNLTAIAPALGFGAFPIGGFADGAFNQLFLFDPDQEGLLTLVALPRLDALDMNRITTPSALASPAVHAAPPSGLDDTGELFRMLHNASCITLDTPPRAVPVRVRELDDPFADADEVIALDHPATPSIDLEDAILSRRSARSFTREAMPLEQMGAILSFAYQPVAALAGNDAVICRQLFAPALLESYVLVNNVSGVLPGIYYYAPGRHELRQVREGSLQKAARHICLGQELGGDASFLVIHTARLERAVACFGERAYRYLHMDAGHLGERMNLAAVHAGLGASGIGGFFDDDVISLLRLSPQDIVVYITTVGCVPPHV